MRRISAASFEQMKWKKLLTFASISKCAPWTHIKWTFLLISLYLIKGQLCVPLLFQSELVSSLNCFTIFLMNIFKGKVFEKKFFRHRDVSSAFPGFFCIKHVNCVWFTLRLYFMAVHLRQNDELVFIFVFSAAF